MMDEVSALAAAGATAIISAMATDAWGSIRARLAKLIGKAGRVEERPDDQAAVLLDKAHAAIMEASDHDRPQVTAVQHTAIRRLLTDTTERDTATLHHIHDLLAEYGMTAEPHLATGGQHNTASGNAQQSVQYSGTQHNTFNRGP